MVIQTIGGNMKSHLRPKSLNLYITEISLHVIISSLAISSSLFKSDGG